MRRRFIPEHIAFGHSKFQILMNIKMGYDLRAFRNVLRDHQIRKKKKPATLLQQARAPPRPVHL